MTKKEKIKKERSPERKGNQFTKRMDVRLIALVVCVYIIVNLISTFVILRNSRLSMEEQMNESIIVTKVISENYIKEFLKPKNNVVDAVSSSTVVSSIVSDGVTVEEEKELLDILTWNNIDKDLLDIYIGTKDKKMITILGGLPEGYDPTSRPWYQEGLKAKEALIMEPYTDAVTGETIISIVKRIEGDSVVGIDILVNKLAESLRPVDEKNVFSDIIVKNVPLATKESDPLYEVLAKKETSFKNYEITYTPLDGFDMATINNVKVSKDTIAKVRLIGIFSSLIALIIFSLMILLYMRRLRKTTSAFNEYIEKVHEGDFTHDLKIDGSDDITGSFRNANESIVRARETFKGVVNSFETLSEASKISLEHINEITDLNKSINADFENLSQSSMSQLEDLEKISLKSSNSMEKVISTLNDFEEIKKKTEKESEKATEMAKDSEAVIKESYEVKSSLSILGKEFENTNTQVKKIQNLADMVRSIANDTNLLSLNASIEAARAGEAGRGFAVVAEEIRKLATNSAITAKEITDSSSLIVSATENLGQSVKALETSNEKQISIVDSQVKDIIALSEDIISISDMVNKSHKDVVAIKNDSEEVADSVQNLLAHNEEFFASMENLEKMSSSISDKTVETQKSVQRNDTDSVKMLEDIQNKFKL